MLKTETRTTLTKKEKAEMRARTERLESLGANLTSLLNDYLLEELGRPIDVYNKRFSEDSQEAERSLDISKTVKQSSKQFYDAFRTLYKLIETDECTSISSPFVDDIGIDRWLFSYNSFGPYRDDECSEPEDGRCSCSLTKKRR